MRNQLINFILSFFSSAYRGAGMHRPVRGGDAILSKSFKLPLYKDSTYFKDPKTRVEYARTYAK